MKQSFKKLSLYAYRFVLVTIVFSFVFSSLPLEDMVQFAKDRIAERNVVDSVYLALRDKNVVDNFHFGPREARANPGTRARTVEYFLGQHETLTNQNDDTNLTFTAQTLNLPEASVSVKSAYIDYVVHLGIAAGMDAFTLSFGRTAGTCPQTITFNARATATGLTAPAGVAENKVIRLRADVTPDFSTYTGGTDQCVNFQYNISTDLGAADTTAEANIVAASAKLVITYNYDDTSATKLNTVYYPLEFATNQGTKATQTAAAGTADFTYYTTAPELTASGNLKSQFFEVNSEMTQTSITDQSSTFCRFDGAVCGTATGVHGFDGASRAGAGFRHLVDQLPGFAYNDSGMKLRWTANALPQNIQGGANIMTYTYLSSAATKTRTVRYRVGEVITAAGSATKSALTGPTVILREGGISVQKAWFRMETSTGAADSIQVTTKVGANAETTADANDLYAVAAPTIFSGQAFYINHVIPSSDYAAINTNANSGVVTQMTADWTTGGGSVSAELYITYTYTNESTGWTDTRVNFAGQMTANGATTFTQATGAIDTAIPDTGGTVAVQSQYIHMQNLNTSATANELRGINLTTTTCTATNTSTAESAAVTSDFALYKSTGTVVTTSDTATYTACYSSGEASNFNGILVYTVTVSITPAAVVTASSTGTQTTNFNSGTTVQYIGAAFRFQQDSGTVVNITALTLTDTGSITFDSSLSEEVANVSLSYKTADTGTCATGGETTVGNGTLGAGTETITWSAVTIPATLSPNFTCIYIRLDAAGVGPVYPNGGDTIDVRIAASADFTVSGGATKAGTFPVDPTGATTVLPVIDSYTNTETGLNWAASCTGCGARIGPRSASQHQAVTINGKGFGVDPGAGLRDSATNKVEIVGVSTNLIDDDGTANTNVQSWNNTTIVINTSSEQTGDTDTDWGTNFGDSAALRVTAGSQVVATDREFFVFPQITSLAVPGGNPANSARETESITLNGTRFGSSQGTGTVTILTVAAGAASSWTNTAITVTVPTAIGDGLGGVSDYTGNVVVTQGTGTNGKTHTYGTSFQILPRITSLTPNSGPNGTSTTIAGDHLCQPSGTCQAAATWNTTANDGNDVKWGTTNATVTGTPINTEIIANAPTLTDGAYSVTVTSGGGTPYTSNGLTFTISNNALTVSTSGSQIATITRGTNNNSLGGTANPSGAFTFVTSASAATITSIKVSETVAGFVANNNLNNIKLYGDTGGTVAGQYEPGLDTQIGTTQTTFAADETVTFGGLTLAVNTTAISVYVVADIDADPTSGQTIEIQITNPSTDVVVTSASNTDAVAKAIAGTTTVANPNITVAAAGSQPVNVARGSTANNLGGAFTLTMASATGSLSTIAISEQGTVAADTNLTSVKLQSDTDGTYPGTDITGCTALSFVAGIPEKVTCTPTGGLALTTTTTYIYVVANVASGATAGQTIELEINVSGDVTGTGFNVSGTFPVQITGTTTIQDPSLTVGTSGSQAANLNSGDTAQHIGGGTAATFTFVLTGATGTLNSFIIAETSASLAAQTDLTSVKFQTDTDGALPASDVTGCTGLSFNASDQITCTPTGGLALSTTVRYVYIVFDLASTAAGGEIIEVQITNPSTDVSVTGAANTDAAAKAIAGTTTIRPKITGYTNSSEAGLNWAASCTGCGARIGPAASSQSQTVVISGAGFGADPGAGSRDTATNKVEIVGVATTLLTDNVGSTNVTAWSTTSITITTDTGVTLNSDTDWGTNFGDSAALRVTAGSQAVATDREFFIFPQITSISNTTVVNGDREGDAIDLNGTRFGSPQGTGTVTILTVDAGAASSWTNTAVTVTVPTAILDSSYTGNIVVTQGTGTNGKTHTFSTFRILPRIISLSPSTGVSGDPIVIIGNHFCQTGTCPLAGSRSTASDNVTFFSGVQVTDANVTAWGHGDSSTSGVNVNVPSAAVTGSVVVKSNTTYDSNGVTFTKQSTIPTDPTSLQQYEADGTTVIVLGNKTKNGVTTNLTFKASMTGFNPSTLCLQIENATVGTAFNGTATAEETGAACESYAGTPVTGSVTITGLTTNTGYHWRARVRNNSTSETSGWVSFGGNTENPPTNPADNDYYIDTAAPVISNISSSNIAASSATITWTTDETADSQVKYGTSCVPGTLTAVSQTTGVASHSVALSGLSSNTAYQYQVVSQDRNADGSLIGNSATGPTASTCNTFTTSKANTKTLEYFVRGETAALSYSAGGNPQTFQATISETGYVLQDVFVEISGIANTGTSLTLSVKAYGATEPAYTNYTVPISSTVTTPFTILYKIDPTATGLYIAPALSSLNTLKISPGSGEPNISVASAKIIITYYAPPQ